MGDPAESAIDGSLFRAIFDHSNDGIAIADSQGRYLAANPVLCDMLGYTEREFCELGILDVLSHADLTRNPIRVETLAQGLPVVSTRELVRKDRSRFMAEISAFPVPDGRIVGFHRDVTDRVNAEKLLREQRDLGLRLATTTSLDGTLRTCLKFAIVASGMDGGAVFLADRPGGDFVLAGHKGLPSAHHGMPSRLSRASSPGREIARGKPLYGRHSELTGIPNEAGPKALALVPFAYQGEVIGCMALVSNALEVPPPDACTSLEAISAQLAQAIARSRAEAQLLEQRAVLEKKVGERTRELQEVNLRLREMIADHEETLAERSRLIAELEAKNTELEQFIYTVSHDLRTPVITINGFAGLMHEDLEEGSLENLASDLNRISEATTQMKNLLDDLVAVSRIGRHRGPVERLSVEALAHDAVNALIEHIEATGARITIDDDLPGATGERLQIRNLLEQLIRNALKFSREGVVPEIHVGATRDGNEVVYFVRDNGMGIDVQHQQRVFNLFEKLDAGSEGTGVGLTVARKVIEVHGGRIWIESSGTNQGTTVKFTLPSWS